MFEYIFLGILQGIFEWLPISSEGVIALFSRFLVKDFNPVDMALFLHLGTFFAVLIYFKKDWQDILTFKNKKMLKFLLISTAVSLVVGYPLYKTIKNVVIGNTFLIVMGFGLLFSKEYMRKDG